MGKKRLYIRNEGTVGRILYTPLTDNTVMWNNNDQVELAIYTDADPRFSTLPLAMLVNVK